MSFRTEVANGKLYLEEQGFTFDIHDPEKMAEFLEHHHGKNAGDGPESVPYHAYRIRFQNTDGPQDYSLQGKSRSYANFYLSDDPDDWASKVHNYREVLYEGLYEGVDLRTKKEKGGSAFKYELHIRPEGDAKDIEFEYQGVDGLEITEEGELKVRTSVGTVKETRPVAYYPDGKDSIPVACSYELEGNKVRFRFPQGLEEDRKLVIDPTLVFSTYSGSGSDNFGYTATFDSEGFLYSGSTAFGNNYPVTVGAYQTSWAGGSGAGNLAGTDIALSKYDTSGTFLVWSTYLGGQSDELPHSMVVNENDELFVYGTTSSPDFPVTSNAYDTSFAGGSGKTLNGIGVDFVNGSDIIISRISNDGTALMASTFLGGTANDGLNTNGNLRYNYADEVRGEIIIDENNHCYIASTTRSTDFPTTSNAYQNSFPGGNQSGCVVQMDNSLTTLLWSSYFGGSGEDAVYSLTLDQNDDLFITGGTTSPDIQTDTSVLQPNNAGGRADPFVAHLNGQGDSLFRATYWGSGDYDQSYFVRLDDDEHIHLFGQTEIMDSTFIINANYATPNSGQYITQMTTEMDSVIWSTVFGSGSGNIDISPTAFLVDVCHKIYLSGWGGNTNDFGGLNNNTGSTNGMDTTSNAYQGTTDGSDFYVMVLKNDASGIVYGSFMGGSQSAEHVDGGTSRFSEKGRIYQSVCAGCGGNSDFPIKPDPGAVSPTNNSTNCNNAVFKMNFDLPITVADMDHPGVVCKGDSVPFTDQSTSGHDVIWDFGDGDSSTSNNPSHVYDSSGTFQVTLYVKDTNTCNLSDSVKSNIQVLADSSTSIPDSSICFGEQTSIGVPPLGDSGITYKWEPTTGLSDSTEPNPIASPDSTIDYQLYISNGVCTDTLLQTVQVTKPAFTTSNDTLLCQGTDSVDLQGSSLPSSSIDEWVWTELSDPSDTLNDNLSDSVITVLPNDTGNYVLKGTRNGCSLKDTVQVLVKQLSANLAPDTTICEGDTAVIKAQVSGTGPFQYDWSPDSAIAQGDSTQQIDVAPGTSTLYQLEVTNGACTDTLTRNIQVTPAPNIQTSNDTILCDGQDSIDLNASSVPPTSIDEWTWTQVAAPLDTLNDGPTDSSITVLPNDSSYYLITATEGNCSTTDTVAVLTTPLTLGLPPDTTICKGDTITLQAQASGAGSLSYDWEPDPSILQGDSSSQITISPSNTTTYTLEVSDSQCTITRSVTIAVSDLGQKNVTATADQDTIALGGSTKIHADPDHTYDVSWTPPQWLEDPNAFHTGASPTSTTTFHLRMTDNGGCLQRDSVRIYVYDLECKPPDLFIPNAFTPNGDGENDVLYVRGKNIQEMTFRVFDRWGEKVFESHDPEKGWDGTYQGRDLDPDVYVYYLEITCQGDKEYFEKGNITLIR